jgi:hypothetical protein
LCGPLKFLLVSELVILAVCRVNLTYFKLVYTNLILLFTGPDYHEIA